MPCTVEVDFMSVARQISLIVGGRPSLRRRTKKEYTAACFWERLLLAIIYSLNTIYMYFNLKQYTILRVGFQHRALGICCSNWQRIMVKFTYNIKIFEVKKILIFL